MTNTNDAGFPEKIDNIPSKYRRCYDDQKRGKKAGSLLLRKCKHCIFWRNPMPGKKAGCQIAWQLDVSKGACPDDFRCKKFLHKEHNKTLKELRELPVGVLRAVVYLSKIADKLGSVSTIEDIVEAVKIVTVNEHRLAVVRSWGKSLLKEKEGNISFDVPQRSEWNILDEATGDHFTGVVWRTSKTLIEVFPDKQYRKKYGHTVKYAPDRFLRIAKRIVDDFDDETEEAEDED